ncbi:MAG: hsp70 family protein [Desulfobacterales bacterium]|nr:hsp70 family protein [Desulfobacterales bacterium]
MTHDVASPFIIGIDLGTTNSAVSFVDMREGVPEAATIRSFPIQQLTGPGELSTLAVLPSFLYIPGSYDISVTSVTHPWQKPDDNFAGAFARDQGARVPARLVASAKSWLCHAGADREGRILPWGAGDEVGRISPVRATAAYLAHLRKAWNRSWGEDDEYYMENQTVVVTVPASFDEVAREFTVTAAKEAGLGRIILIEEPLAAFYSWLIRHEKRWQDHVHPGELILVCDVGGGTTDFTLISLRDVDGSPRFERIAVGDHLILGGDNVDLALARMVEERLKDAGRAMAGDSLRNLIHQCRQVKETLLSGDAETGKISLAGRGSRLIAGTVTAELDRETVESAVLDAFFPVVAPDDAGPTGEGGAVTEFGLPYEPDPAITRHLGRFLERHREDVARLLGRDSAFPDLILFNGGSLKPPLTQDRIRQSLRHWFGQSDISVPRVLENPGPDIAVSLGATYYGLVKAGHGVRVGSGSARSFYLGVEKPSAASDDATPVAICLVERGQQEGTEIVLPDGDFEVLANQPVAFDLYSSSYRSGDRCGRIVTVDETLTALPPMKTVIQFGKSGDERQVPVRVEGSFTEMGTLALWCGSRISPHRWQLQFQLRGAAAPREIQETAVLDSGIVASACKAIRQSFLAHGDGSGLEGLGKTLARIIDMHRDRWPLGALRALADELIDLQTVRQTGPAFEARWLNLMGFCLRPGFGDGFDSHRAQALWKIYPKGPIHSHPQVRTEWWILWRRVAAGLRPGQQRQIVQDLSSVLMPGKGGGVKIAPQQRLEMWMAVSNLELLQPADKVKWGRHLLAEIHPKRSKPQQLWSLSRIGARLLLYGSADRVVPATEAEKWCDGLMEKNWRNPVPVGMALAQMARKTGDRTRDLSPAAMARIGGWLAVHPKLAHLCELLEQVVALQSNEAQTVFGESLPRGLILKG